MSTNVCLLFGAGGHAKVVLEALLLGRPGWIVQVCDDNPALKDTLVLGHRIGSRCLETEVRGKMVHVAVGDNVIRERLGLLINAASGRLCTVIHPNANVSPSSMIGQGAFVAAMSIIGPEALIGDGVIVNHGAVIDHDCRLGAWTHVAPGAVVGGGVIVDDGAFLGSRCVVLPGLHIGEGASIGAGSVVTRDVPAGLAVKGVPAK